MTILELINYTIMGYQLDPLKYSLGVTCILILINFFESILCLFFILMPTDFLIGDQFRKVR